MSYYIKNIISESEKRRIYNLHNNRRNLEFSKLLKEADENTTEEVPAEIKTWFETTLTKRFGNTYPTKGTYTKQDDGNWGYTPPFDTIVLKQDGTVIDTSDPSKTGTWTQEKYVDTSAQDAEIKQKQDAEAAQQKQDSIQSAKDAEVQQADDQGLKAWQYTRQARKKTKMEQKDFKNLTNKCTKYKEKYTKLFNSTARNENRRNWDKNQAKKVLQDIRNECCTVVEDRFGQVLGNPLGTDNVSNAYCNTENTTTQQNTTT